jgi:hypothetical protein
LSALIEQGPLALFAAFVVAHAVADFPLQGDYLARMKVRSQAPGLSEWLVALSAHSLIHAGGVWLVSGSLALGALEFVLHALIDVAKGEGKTGLLTDQALHLACKLGYVVILMAWP